MKFELICDIIVMIGAACIGITQILNFFGKPTSKLLKRSKANSKAMVKEVLKEELTQALYNHDLETRERYLTDRLNYLNEIKEEVLRDTEDILVEIKEINIKQSEALEKLNQSSKDMLRQSIMSIYFKNVNNKTISTTDKEILNELYKDYKNQNGNSYIDKYYGRMCTWKEVEDYGEGSL